MKEMKSLNGYEIVDAKARERLDPLEKAVGEITPRALVRQIRFYDEDKSKFVTFEDVFVGVKDEVTTTLVYGLEAHGINSTEQSLYVSKDGGETWSVYGTFAIDAAGGKWYTSMFIDEQTKTLYLFKTNDGFDMKNNQLCVFIWNGVDPWYPSNVLNLGSRRWLSNNNSIDVCSSADWTQRNVIFGEYDVTLDGSPYKIWQTKDNGRTWNSVLEFAGDTGVAGTGPIRHWHCVFADPYTKHWWATAGDAGEQCRIYRSKQNGDAGTWELVFSGSQRERTCGFIFEKDCIYYAMDSTNKQDEESIKIVKIDRAKLDTDRENCREDVAFVDSAYAVYGLSKVYFPEGFIVWAQFETSVASFEKNRYVLQFYEYGTRKMYPIARFDTTSISKDRYTGFFAGARMQVHESGVVFARPTPELNQGRISYNQVSTHIKINVTC